jgi:chromosome segregation ATPase
MLTKIRSISDFFPLHQKNKNFHKKTLDSFQKKSESTLHKLKKEKMNNNKVKILKYAALSTSFLGSISGIVTSLEAATYFPLRSDSNVPKEDKWPLLGNLQVSLVWLERCVGNSVSPSVLEDLRLRLKDLLDDAKRRAETGKKAYSVITGTDDFQGALNEAGRRQTDIQKNLRAEIVKFNPKSSDKSLIVKIANMIAQWWMQEHIANEIGAIMKTGCPDDKKLDPRIALTERLQVEDRLRDIQLRAEAAQLRAGAAWLQVEAVPTEAEAASLRVQATQLQAEAAYLRADAAWQQTRAAQLRAEAAPTAKEATRLRAEVARLQDETSRLWAKARRLQAKTDQLQNARLRAGNPLTEEEVSRLQSALAPLRAVFAQSQTKEQDTAIAPPPSETSSLQAEIIRMQRIIAQQKTEIGQVVTQLRDAIVPLPFETTLPPSETSSLQAEIIRMQGIIAQQKTEIEQVVTQLRDAIAPPPFETTLPPSETSSLQAAITSLQTEIISIQRIIAEKDHENIGQQATIDLAVTRLRDTADQLKARIDRAAPEEATADQMRNQIDLAAARLRRAAPEGTTADQIRSQIDRAITQLRNETSSLPAAIDQIVTQLQTAVAPEEATTNQMRDQIDLAVTRLRAETAPIQAEIARIQKMIAEEGRIIDQQKEQIDRLENPSWGEAIMRLITPRRSPRGASN